MKRLCLSVSKIQKDRNGIVYFHNFQFEPCIPSFNIIITCNNVAMLWLFAVENNMLSYNLLGIIKFIKFLTSVYFPKKYMVIVSLNN